MNWGIGVTVRGQMFLAGLAAFLFSFFFFQGLPLTFGDDLNIIFTAKNTSWDVLFKELLNPWTAAWYVHGEDCLLTTRVFQTIIFKAIHAVFGYHPDPFNFLKAAGFSVCAAYSFKLAAKTSNQNFYGWLAAILFIFSAPIFYSASWIADTEILGQAFLIIAFSNLLSALSCEPANVGSVNRAFKIFIFFVAAWLSMKLKETTRIIPFVVLAFLFCKTMSSFWKREKIGGEVWGAFGVNIVLLMAVIPFFPSQVIELDHKSVSAMSRIQWENALDIGLFFLSDTALIIICCVAGLIFFGSHKNRSSQSSFSSDVFLLLFFWLGASSAGTMLNFDLSSNLRYLTTPLVPAYVFLVCALGYFDKSNLKKRYSRSFFCVICLAACLFKVGLPKADGLVSFKLDSLVFFRNFNLGINIADFKLTHALLCGHSGYCPDGESLDRFYREDVRRFREMRFKEWDTNLKLDDAILKQAHETWGHAYVMSLKEDLSSSIPSLALIYRGDTANPSLYAKLIPKIKKKSLRKIYLYQYQPA